MHRELEKLMVKVGGNTQVMGGSAKMHMDQDHQFMVTFRDLLQDWMQLYKSEKTVDLALLKEIYRFQIEILPCLLQTCPPVVKSAPHLVMMVLFDEVFAKFGIEEGNLRDHEHIEFDQEFLELNTTFNKMRKDFTAEIFVDTMNRNMFPK